MIKALSYSEYYQYTHDGSAWYEQYVLGWEKSPNDKMIFGKKIHNEIENRLNAEDAKVREEQDKCLIEWLKEQGVELKRIANIQKVLAKKELQHIKRKAIGINVRREVAMGAEFDGIPLFGYFDGLDVKFRLLDEDKTVEESGKWHQPRVDNNEQLSFYALIFWLNFHSYFREINLNQINTVKGTMKTFDTVRSKADIEEMKRAIKQIKEEMDYYGFWEIRLTSKERALLNQQTLKL